jgi:flagellar biosynthetic protein FliQ
MTEALVVSLMNEAMRMTTILAAPLLLGALVVGLIISIFQAVTQIQEQTLAIIPKMAAILVILAVLFPWMLAQATAYMNGLFSNFPRYLGL